MDEKSKAILAGFTGKRKRSQLTPHRDLICKLHRRGCAFREIVSILSENFNLTVAPSTVCRFIARLEKEDTKPRKSKPQKERPVTSENTVNDATKYSVRRNRILFFMALSQIYNLRPILF